jgi:hypothetical protein
LKQFFVFIVIFVVLVIQPSAAISSSRTAYQARLTAPSTAHGSSTKTHEATKTTKDSFESH